jgi:hypothetical protein
MRWTQERLGTIRAYVFAAVALLILVVYLFER